MLKAIKQVVPGDDVEFGAQLPRSIALSDALATTQDCIIRAVRFYNHLR